MYFLGYKREDICLEKTSRLDWLNVRNMINDIFFKRIAEYNPFGAKEGAYSKYATINFVEKMIEGVKDEDILEYSVALPLLVKWMKNAIAIRKEDIKARRAVKVQKDKDRAEAIEKNAQIGKQRDEGLQAAIVEAKAVMC